MSSLMGSRSTSLIVRRADVDVAIARFEEVRPVTDVAGLDKVKGGGAGGIRTLDRALQPYNGLANRRLQPLGHSSISADMPDASASRKRQIRITRRSFKGAAGASREFSQRPDIPYRAFGACFRGLCGVVTRSRPVTGAAFAERGLTGGEFALSVCFTAPRRNHVKSIRRHHGRFDSTQIPVPDRGAQAPALAQPYNAFDPGKY